MTTSNTKIEGLGRRNPVEILHETHTGRLKIRDKYGYKLRVDSSRVKA